jgi:hypothetical protein
MARTTPETRERVGRGIGSLPAPTEFATFLPVTDPEMLAMYEQALANAGGDTRAAYAQTGFYSGPETGGQLVREISDANARFINRDRLTAGEELRLGDVLYHPDLYSEMPELADIPVRSPTGEATDLRIMGGRGSYNPRENSIEISADVLDSGFGPNTIRDDFTYERSPLAPEMLDDEGVRRVLLHEAAGHAVQQAKGLPQGSNPMLGFFTQGLALEDLPDSQSRYEDLMALRELTGDLSPEQEALASEILSRAFQRPPIALPIDPTQMFFPFEYYRSTPGEAAARLIEARSRMTPEELRASYPPDMLDVSQDSIRYATELERRLQEE